jgi:tetratricopeptide (TPR) repeat protein/energy-coupling factor transporter ATP-binding protein EcfA2
VKKQWIFVGRMSEVEQFVEVLERPRGEAVVVMGQRGMGKTWLINKMGKVAENHPELKCGWIRYEVTPTDSVNETMALMMDNAFEAASTKPGSFDKVPQRRKQWMALLKLGKLIPGGKIAGKMAGEKAERIVELWKSIKRDSTKNTREQFLERLSLISKRMPENGRAIFIIDPEKYMQEKSDQSWAIIMKQLPDKIKFVFAQRPEDVLIDSETFEELDNVVRVPGERLGVLEEEAVDELLTRRIKGTKYTVTEVRKVLNSYEGHPYALGAALDLLEAGTNLEKLPDKPEPRKFAEVQWKRARGSGDGAIELLEAYAVLEVGVPYEVVEIVSGLKSSVRKKLLADKYLIGLLREEGVGRRIYHAILADYILGQIGEEEKKQYHKRVVSVYKRQLRNIDYSTTIQLLKSMEAAELVPNVRIYNALISKAHDYHGATDCLRMIFKSGIRPSIVTYNTLIKKAVSYNKAKSWVEAIYEENMKPDIITYNSIIKKAYSYNTAMNWLNKMGEQNMEPNIVTYNSIIYKAPNYDTAKNLVERMCKEGVTPNVFTYNTLVDKAPDYDTAMNLVERMREENIHPDVWIYSTLLKKTTDYNTAKDLVETMHKKGVPPNVVTYTTLVQKAPDYDTAKSLVERMRDDRIKPNIVTYCILFSKDLSRKTADDILRWYFSQEYHSEEPIQAAITSYRKIGRINQALRLALDYPHSRAAIKVIHEHSEEATQYFQNIFDNDSEHPNGAYALGITFFELEEMKKAKMYLQKSLKLATASARKTKIEKLLSKIGQEG